MTTAIDHLARDLERARRRAAALRAVVRHRPEVARALRDAEIDAGLIEGRLLEAERAEQEERS